MVGLGLSVLLVVASAPATKVKPPAPRTAAVETAPVTAAHAAAAQPQLPPAPPPPADVPVAVLLLEARQRFDALDYDEVIPMTQQLLARPEVTVEQRLDACLLQGSSLAIVGDPIEAEKPFRFLLRGRPDFDLPADTPPKILAIFRKVQAEERAIIDQMRELERARILKDLEISGDALQGLEGGQPIELDYRVRDPRGVVSAFRVHYRKKGEGAFSSLALVRDPKGAWRGEIPGEWTANDDGFTFEYYLATADAEGQGLIEKASAQGPLSATVSPGEYGDPTPFYQTVWFWAATVLAVAAAGVSSYLVLKNASELPETDLGTVSIR